MNTGFVRSNIKKIKKLLLLLLSRRLLRQRILAVGGGVGDRKRDLRGLGKTKFKTAAAAAA